MKMIKITKKGFNVEIYIDRDYNVDININNKNVTYCDGETIRNNAEIDGVTPQEWIDAFVVDPLETVETLEQVLDEFGLPYVIGDTVYDLIDDYAASDAYSEEDVAQLRAMSPERLQEVFRCTNGIAFIKTRNQYALVWVEKQGGLYETNNFATKTQRISR